MAKEITSRLLRVPEFAERLGLRPSTVRAWILHRRVAFVRIGLRAIRIPESEAQRLIGTGFVPAREPNDGR
jgi:excisionase family DNA binding protein